MIDKNRAAEICRGFSEQDVMVVGDLMLDRYVTGTVRRISPEAPVPVVQVTGERSLPGGAANVAKNIGQLGGKAYVAGAVGADKDGDELIHVLEQSGADVRGVFRCEGFSTTVKTRIVADRQQVVRVDTEASMVFDAAMIEGVRSRVSGLIGSVGGVIIEDYGKGTVCQPVVDTVCAESHAQGVAVGLDPKDNHDLQFSYLTLATPNYAEACSAAGIPVHGRVEEPETDEALASMGQTLLERWHADLLVITLGPKGMYLMNREQPPQVIPTHAREVYDVSGAGDTVIATAMLALLSGASHYEAAALANYAAGIVVGKLGAATCTTDELLETIE